MVVQVLKGLRRTKYLAGSKIDLLATLNLVHEGIMICAHRNSPQ